VHVIDSHLKHHTFVNGVRRWPARLPPFYGLACSVAV